MTLHTDTIFALSTARGVAGIAVVRVSGPRAGAALEGLVGPLTNMNVLRFDVSGNPAFAELVDRVTRVLARSATRATMRSICGPEPLWRTTSAMKGV